MYKRSTLMKKGCVLLLGCLWMTQTIAQEPSPVQLINPPGLAVPTGYSQVAIVDLGNCSLLLLSGQVSLDSLGQLVGGHDMELQARQVFENIQLIVESRGGTMRDVIKLTYYVIDATQLTAIRRARDEYIDRTHPPASTLLQVSRLYRDDVLLEVEATAIIPKKK